MRKYLADTNVLLWLAGDPNRIGVQVRRELANPANRIFVSVVSLWEIEIKRSLGKLSIADDFPALLQKVGFEELPVSSRYLEALAALPMHHRDPFDRMLVAQAIHDGLTLVTSDRRLPMYAVPVLTAY